MNILGFTLFVALLVVLLITSLVCFRASRRGGDDAAMLRFFGLLSAGLFLFFLLYAVSLLFRIHTPFEPGAYQEGGARWTKPVPDMKTPPPGANPAGAEQDEEERLRRAQRQQEDSFKH